MDVGRGIYTDMVRVHNHIRTFPTHDSNTTQICGVVAVYDTDIFGVYVGVRNYWNRRHNRQLAVQYLVLGHVGNLRLRVGNDTCSKKMPARVGITFLWKNKCFQLQCDI